MPSRSKMVLDLIRATGPRSAVSIIGRRILKRPAPVTVSAGAHSISVRPMDSDLWVLGQIFGASEYDIGPERTAGLNKLAGSWRRDGVTPVIIDGGANVGYSAIYFAQTYPDAVVLAIEPDAGTLAQARRNCAGIDRIIPVHAALWTHGRGVSLVGEGKASWGRSVSDEGLTPSLTLEMALARVTNGRLLILKLDIEGAEREVCAASADAVRAAPCIMVEPHDFLKSGHGSLAPLFSAIAGRDVDTLIVGENLIIADTALVGAGVASRPPEAERLNVQHVIA